MKTLFCLQILKVGLDDHEFTPDLGGYKFAPLNRSIQTLTDQEIAAPFPHGEFDKTLPACVQRLARLQDKHSLAQITGPGRRRNGPAPWQMRRILKYGPGPRCKLWAGQRCNGQTWARWWWRRRRPMTTKTRIGRMTTRKRKRTGRTTPRGVECGRSRAAR